MTDFSHSGFLKAKSPYQENNILTLKYNSKNFVIS